MRGLRGVIAGALVLVGVQALIGTRQGPQRAAGLIGVVTGAVADFLDPRKPFLGDRAAAPVAPKIAGAAAKPADLRIPDPSKPPVRTS